MRRTAAAFLTATTLTLTVFAGAGAAHAEIESVGSIWSGSGWMGSSANPQNGSVEDPAPGSLAFYVMNLLSSIFFPMPECGAAPSCQG